MGTGGKFHGVLYGAFDGHGKYDGIPMEYIQ